MTANTPQSAGSWWTDKRFEQWLGSLLRTGVLIAAAVTIVGGIVILFTNGRDVPDYRVFHGEPAGLLGFRGVVSGVLRGDGRSIAQLGLILLIATPVARVLLSLVTFFLQRDRLYVVITTIVLAVLLFGFVWGGRF